MTDSFDPCRHHLFASIVLADSGYTAKCSCGETFFDPSPTKALDAFDRHQDATIIVAGTEGAP